MVKIINIIEALIALGGAVWLFLYYDGRLNYHGEKEKRRKEKVEKHGWAIALAAFMCLFGGLAIIVGIFL